MKHRLGDVIEFRDGMWEKGKWVPAESLYVGRISCIYQFIGGRSPGQPEWELWLEYYSEMPGRTFVPLEAVVRVIEEGKVEFKQSTPEFYIGTKVRFDDGGKMLYDEIIGYEYRFSEVEGIDWQYKMKFSGYTMGTDEFTII